MNGAAKLMQIMVENFTSTRLFGGDNLRYFSEVTADKQAQGTILQPNSNHMLSLYLVYIFVNNR